MRATTTASRATGDRRWRFGRLAVGAPLLILLLGSGPLATELTSRAAATAQGEEPDSVLYLWTGDVGVGAGSPVSPSKEFDVVDGEDFLAVVDADPDSATYGKVLRTVSVPTPPTGNEPHHLQPFTPPGCETVFGGSLFSDFWYNFDISDPLEPVLSGTITPAATQGTVPDAAFVLPNCEALATEMGGDPTTGSYPGGPHGTVIRMDPPGQNVVETQLADRIPTDAVCHSQWSPVARPGKLGGPFTRKTDPGDCLPSNPHGIWARPDLDTLVTSDYATPAHLILPLPPTSEVAKMTVRHYPLDPACTGPDPSPAGVDCIGDPRVVLLPDGPRAEPNEGHEENVGVMEVATTHAAGALNPTGATPPGYLPSNGAFAATMCGGALYYTPDITAEEPQWREVFDYTAANQVVNPGSPTTSGCTGGGAVVPTPDNRFVLHSIIGRDHHQTGGGIAAGTSSSEFPGMIVALDVAALIRAGDDVRCTIDTTEEVWRGGSERDCPTIADVHVAHDPTAGGPHFFSFDWGRNGERLAYFHYFVSETGVTGDLRVCMLTRRGGQLETDRSFPAAVDGQNPGSGCISFNRPDWPDDRGAGAGPAKPHYGLFHRVE